MMDLEGFGHPGVNGIIG